MDADRSEALIDAVRAARAEAQPISLLGAGSKAFLLPGTDGTAAAGPSGRLLSLGEHAGVIEHRADELVITARAGTPLRELKAELLRVMTFKM